MKFLILVSILTSLFFYQNCGSQFATNDVQVHFGTNTSTSESTSSLEVPDSEPKNKILIQSTWYWQLTGSLRTDISAQVYDIDLYTNSQDTIKNLKEQGRTVICYFSAGSYEPDRPDSHLFPKESLGLQLVGWPQEKWLDINHPEVRQIMKNRIELAKQKGCDGIEPDNVDGHANKNGFHLTSKEQIDFNLFLSQVAHEKGLLIGLKNAMELLPELKNHFDFAVNEECFQYNECDQYEDFLSLGKAVFNAEYKKYSEQNCKTSKALGLSTAYFNLDLDGRVYMPCKTRN